VVVKQNETDTRALFVSCLSNGFRHRGEILRLILHSRGLTRTLLRRLNADSQLPTTVLLNIP
jgi:hypothetical protein